MSLSLYETPDGENCAKKFIDVCCNIAYPSFVYGMAWTVGPGRPKSGGLLMFVGRVGSYMTVPVAMAATFASMVCISAHARGKNGELNHFIGGAAATAPMAYWFGQRGAWIASPFLGVFCMALKHAKELGHEFFPGAPGHTENRRRSILGNNDFFMGPSSWRGTYKEPTDY